MTVIDSLSEHAASRPDHPAMEDMRADRVVSYAELPQLVDIAAANLLDLGVQNHDFVGIMLPGSADHIIVRLALEKIGAVIIPIRRTMPDVEKQAAIDDLEVKAIVTNAKYRNTVPPGPLRLDIDFICGNRSTVAPIGELPTHGLDDGAPLITTKTSGTTGEPKRLLLSRVHVRERSRISIGPMELTSDVRFLQAPALEYLHGYELCLNTLLIGGTVVLGHPMRGHRDQLSHLERKKITLLNLAPSELPRILGAIKDEEGPRFPNLTLVFGGAPLTSDLYDVARAKITPKVFDWYGSSEIGGVSIATPLDREKHPDSVGRILDGIEVQVVGDDGVPLPAMEVGLIGFRAFYFPAEYHNNSDATAHHFRGGWFYPGDFAAINEDGYIFIMGRADDAINFMGENFFPAETESVLRSHPAVDEAAVFGWKHRTQGELPVAAVVAKEFVSRETLDKLCEENLAIHKRPRWIELVQELPRNLGGKVMKSKLKDIVRPPWAK